MAPNDYWMVKRAIGKMNQIEVKIACWRKKKLNSIKAKSKSLK